MNQGKRPRRGAPIDPAELRRVMGEIEPKPPTGPGAAEPPDVELARALLAYGRIFGRKFPTWSEALEVLKVLGYEKRC